MKLGVFNLWTEMHHHNVVGGPSDRSSMLETRDAAASGKDRKDVALLPAPWTALEAMPLPRKPTAAAAEAVEGRKSDKPRRSPKKRRAAVIVDEITAI